MLGVGCLDCSGQGIDRRNEISGEEWIMGVIDWLLRRRPSGRDVAKERLQSILLFDRTGVPPQLFQLVKGDLIDSVARHLIVDRRGVEIVLTQERVHGRGRLVASIPILGPRQGRSTRWLDGDHRG